MTSKHSSAKNEQHSSPKHESPFKSECGWREMLLERTPPSKHPRVRIPRNSKKKKVINK